MVIIVLFLLTLPAPLFVLLFSSGSLFCLDFSFGAAAEASGVDCVLNCSQEFISVSLQSTEAYLHLPMLVRTNES